MTINERIDKLEKHFDKKFMKMKEYVDEKIGPMHDYLVGQEAISKNLNKPSISIDPKIYDLLKWAFLVAILALGGAKFL